MLKFLGPGVCVLCMIDTPPAVCSGPTVTHLAQFSSACSVLRVQRCSSQFPCAYLNPAGYKVSLVCQVCQPGPDKEDVCALGCPVTQRVYVFFRSVLRWSSASDTRTSPTHLSAHSPDIGKQVVGFMSSSEVGSSFATSTSELEISLVACAWLSARTRGTRCWSPTCGSGRGGTMRTWSGIKRTMMVWRWSTSPAAWCGGLTSSSTTSTCTDKSVNL